MASLSDFDTHLVDQRVKTLVNAQLKSILKKEKLAVSGVKAAMQDRIIGRKLSESITFASTGGCVVSSRSRAFADLTAILHRASPTCYEQRFRKTQPPQGLHQQP